MLQGKFRKERIKKRFKCQSFWFVFKQHVFKVVILNLNQACFLTLKDILVFGQVKVRGSFSCPQSLN